MRERGVYMLKTWLTRHSRRLLLLGIAAAAAAAFALGWYAGSNASARKAYAALWEAMIDLPDPERCALCWEGIRYHAPCLVDLSTGRMGEMTVYTRDPSKQGEIAPMEEQQTGTFTFQLCAGLLGVRDTCTHTYKITLPKEKALLNPALYCKECRELLAGAGLEGYVIVDLYDRDSVQAYPIRDVVIRDYRISVSGQKDGRRNVCVTGLL